MMDYISAAVHLGLFLFLRFSLPLVARDLPGPFSLDTCLAATLSVESGTEEGVPSESFSLFLMFFFVPGGRGDAQVAVEAVGGDKSVWKEEN